MPSGAIILDALSAPLKIERQWLPCAVLRELLSHGKLPRCRRELQDLALLWAAVQHAALVAVRTDWPDAPPMRSQGRTQPVRTRPSAVTAWRLELAPAPPTAALVMPRATVAFLANLGTGFVHEVTRWAPPVVALAPGEDGHVGAQEEGQGRVAAPVLGNVVSAFLAKYVDPERKVWVRTVDGQAPTRLNLQQLAVTAIPLLMPVVAQYRDRIVRACPDSGVASLLTGLGRAMVFRIRSA